MNARSAAISSAASARSRERQWRSSATPAALEDDCRSADIVIAPFTIGKRCRAARVIIDRRMLRAEGAYALYTEGLSIRAESVAEARGRRPWVPDRTAPPTSPAQK
jgi:hypothetical protein